MAVYMKRKGYEWDTKKANYVKANTEDEDGKQIQARLMFGQRQWKKF